MAESLDARIRERFHLPNRDIRTYPVLSLAYLGDGIYDLVIRSIVAGRKAANANRLHQASVYYVNAHAQSVMIEGLMPGLTEEELAVYRRGRNAHSYTMAKNATAGDYRRATGFEALMGYLYLTDQMDRILDLVAEGIRILEEEQGDSAGTEEI